MDVTENYYKDTAFTLRGYNTFQGEEIKAAYEHLDLRVFGDCPYLLDSGMNGLWYRYMKKKKPHGNFITKQYVRWIKKKHRQVLKQEVGSKSGFLFLIQAAGICGMWVFPFIYFLINLYLWFIDPSENVWKALFTQDIAWIVSVSFLIKKLAQFGISYYDDESGLIFDRPSGTVKKLNCDGTISAVYDFKDFTAQLKTFINTGGQKERTAFVSSGKHGESVMIGQGIVQGAIKWSYLVRFMDVTQPLLDIPEHEITRHLDPVTKAYDEEVGRDPTYWAKKDRKEVRKMEQEDFEKASKWVDERIKLLQEKGVKDHHFLNNLINPAASMAG